jgi:hypothetical protein
VVSGGDDKARDAKPRYRVERATPDEAYADLARIWSANLGLEADPSVKHAWLYRDAPEVAPAVFMLVAEGGGGSEGRVGTAGVGVRRIAVGDRELRAGLLGDLAVDRDHRSVMPALTLVREVRTWALAELELAYGFPNRAAEGVFKRVGYKALGSMTRYVRVLRHAHYLDRVGDAELERLPKASRKLVAAALARPSIAGLLARGMDAAMIARRGVQLAQAARRVKLEWLTGADERIDALWATARHDYDVVAARTRRFIDWRFFQGAGAARRTIALAVDRGGAPRAYAVIEQHEDAVHLRDVFGHRTEIAALIDRLVPALYRRGAANISIRYLGEPWLVGVLASRGFVARPSHRMIAIGTGANLDPHLAELVMNADAWHLTDADEDT